MFKLCAFPTVENSMEQGPLGCAPLGHWLSKSITDANVAGVVPVTATVIHRAAAYHAGLLSVQRKTPCTFGDGLTSIDIVISLLQALLCAPRRQFSSHAFICRLHAGHGTTMSENG